MKRKEIMEFCLNIFTNVQHQREFWKNLPPLLPSYRFSNRKTNGITIIENKTLIIERNQVAEIIKKYFVEAVHDKSSGSTVDDVSDHPSIR